MSEAQQASSVLLRKAGVDSSILVRDLSQELPSVSVGFNRIRVQVLPHVIEETNLKALSYIAHHKKCKFLISKVLDSLPNLMYYLAAEFVGTRAKNI